MDNRTLAAQPEQQNIGDPAIEDWETEEDEEGTDTSHKPEVITTLFERKPLESPSKLSNLQSLLTMLLLRFKEKGQEFDVSPSAIHRSMIAKEDKHCPGGAIRQHMNREREGNTDPYLRRSIQAGRRQPRGELQNYSGLEATRSKNLANDQDNKDYESTPPGKEIVYVGHCNDSINPRTISLCVKDPSGNIEWENHQLDSVQRRLDFQSTP